MMCLQLSTKAQELTLESDRYQITYNRFGVNIRESSVITLDHYFALRTLYATVRGNVSERYAAVISCELDMYFFSSQLYSYYSVGHGL